MEDGSIPLLVAMVILVILSGFFSASETAYSSLNQIRLKSRADSGDQKAAQILALSERYDSLLSTILIGNNIVNIALASIGTVFFTGLLGGASGPTVSTAVITVTVLIFGEITPKSMAKEMPEKFASFSAPVLHALITVFTPVNFLFSAWKKFLSRHFHGEENDGITDAELMTMVSEAENDGELTNHESELIRSAIEFDDVEVEEVLTPRVDVVAVADDISMQELADAFDESGYSRLPVYHETIDNIIGVVHEKDYYQATRRGSASMDELVAPTLYTTGSTQISALLRTLREKHHHMAVVVDEYGGTEGIVTLEDILEELVGEIWDEHDEETEEFRRQSNGNWLVSGSASVDDLWEELSIPEDREIDSITVSGLVQEKTGRLPKVGDHFTIDRYDGVVTKTAHRRVLEVSLRERKVIAPAPEERPREHSRREARNRAD
ncbi:MAG: hemolysin family protein [Gemmiger sp.]|uniref:HlyC/CorC family transporter n=1 Tax=Gemmiger sp. TaxID=2049027 RepID=UPI002A8158A0|nr:hemolysin family protein [Gemmiger sp.]MCI6083645.1 hemolysin family protein [bacterium]MCI7325950.1 hemolysin family protein [bacterium]MDY4879450.1 hemolysin family protein [Gemmiger sp.]